MDNFYLKVIRAFNVAEVEYLVVGGFAVNYYGYNRATGDLDLWISPRSSNLIKIEDALNRIGFEFGAEAQQELVNENIVSFEEDGCIIELIPRMNISREVSFDQAKSRSQSREVEGIEVRVIGLADLKDEKAKSGRYKDLDDLSKLDEAEAYYKRLKEE